MRKKSALERWMDALLWSNANKNDTTRRVTVVLLGAFIFGVVVTLFFTRSC